MVGHRGNNMTISLSVATIVYVASCLTIVGGAIKILIEAKKAVEKPVKDVQEKVETHEEWLEKNQEHLDKIDSLIEELGEAVNLLVSADCVILDYLKDGQNEEEIDETIKAMDGWLVSRKKYKVE